MFIESSTASMLGIYIRIIVWTFGSLFINSIDLSALKYQGIRSSSQETLYSAGFPWFMTLYYFKECKHGLKWWGY